MTGEVKILLQIKMTSLHISHKLVILHRLVLTLRKWLRSKCDFGPEITKEIEFDNIMLLALWWFY